MREERSGPECKTAIGADQFSESRLGVSVYREIEPASKSLLPSSQSLIRNLQPLTQPAPAQSLRAEERFIAGFNRSRATLNISLCDEINE